LGIDLPGRCNGDGRNMLTRDRCDSRVLGYSDVYRGPLLCGRRGRASRADICQDRGSSLDSSLIGAHLGHAFGGTGIASEDEGRIRDDWSVHSMQVSIRFIAAYHKAQITSPSDAPTQRRLTYS
jgi:hypothetical protein